MNNQILERLYALMKKRGVNAKRVCEDLNMSNSAFTDWKNGGCSPGVKSLSKLSGYFGVSLDYLVTGRENETDQNAHDREFMKKFDLLPPVCREKVAAYIDGMLDASAAGKGAENTRRL